GIERVHKLESLQGELERMQHAAIRLALENKPDEARVFVGKEFRPLAVTFIDEARRFYEQQSKLLDKGRADISEQVGFLTLVLAAVSLFAILAGLTIGMNLSRIITSQLRESIAQLSSSSAEIV